MRLILRRLAWSCLLVPAIAAMPLTLRVPSGYPTIQTAMDSVAAGDTILVEVGTYHEALMAPRLPFVLRGDVTADSGDYPRPTIDPAPLPGSDSLSCITIPAGGAMTIKDFRFFNGPAMHINRNAYFPGGIWNFSEDSLILRRCVFDSVFMGFRYGSPTIWNHTTIENCQFTNMYSCGGSKGPLTVRDCLFQGVNQYGIGGRDSVLIERCRFIGRMVWGGWTGVYGIDDTIRNCVFGPGECSEWLEVAVRGGSTLVEGNVMDSVRVTGEFCVLYFRDGAPLEFRGNLFTHLYGTGPLPIRGTHYGYENSDGAHPLGLRMEANTYADCQLGQGFGWMFEKILNAWGTCQITGNHFIRLRPRENPVIQPSDTIADRQLIRNNIFVGTGFATGCINDSARLDARWNYWGDSTGPFHIEQNPGGLGDSLMGYVDFIPWYPDTTFLSVGTRRSPLPEHYEIAAYPNPFNSSARLTLISPAITIVRVELYDILGRRVREVWSGIVPYRREIPLKADDLPSGSYFARVSDATSGSSRAAVKLVLIR